MGLRLMGCGLQLVFARKDSNVIETVKRTDVMSVD